MVIFFTHRTSWIYQTDTRGLMKDLAANYRPMFTLRTNAIIVVQPARRGIASLFPVELMHRRKYEVACEFLVGADGGHSESCHNGSGSGS
ncbi:MAG: hypothetical protein U0519_04175 [Candidatus Gracilibacteria bacterium]